NGESYSPQPSEFIEMAELRADQPTSLRFGEYGPGHPGGYGDEGHATLAADASLYSEHAERASTYASRAASLTSERYEDAYEFIMMAPTLPAYAVQRAAQTELLRDISGNPFRPVTLDPSCKTPAVVQLARSLYEERRFEDLPVLADALEEAGCQDAAA